MAWARWRDAEDAVLLEKYQKIGGVGCMPLLPGRNLQSIYQRATQLKIKAPRRCGPSLFRRKYPIEEWIDTAIRAGYASATKPGDIVSLANRVGRPPRWVTNRALELGLGTSGVQNRPWEKEELELLEKYAPCTVRYVADQLRLAGHKRSISAISNMLKRMKFDRTDPDSWSASELAGLLGISGPTVQRWISMLNLKAERRGTDHPNDAWLIRRKDIRKWLAAHPAAIDLRKVDQTWFMDLAFGDA